MFVGGIVLLDYLVVCFCYLETGVMGFYWDIDMWVINYKPE